MSIKWLDNAFWTDGTAARKDTITAIREVQHSDDSPVDRQVITISKLSPDESTNPDWVSVLEQLGEDTIEANTQQRVAKKAADREKHMLHQQEVAKAKSLEELFNYKLKAFEVEDIKNSKNRPLKAKLRKAKNVVEVNVFATMIIMEKMNEAAEEDSK